MALDPQLRNRMVLPMIADLAEHLAIIARHQVEIIITSVGSPRDVVAPIHEYGGLVLADVASMRHAERAIEAGCDGLILLSAGAGGQTGWANPFAFVRQVREIFDGIVVLAGGVTDAHGLRAAEVLGCDLAYMGTRLIATQESLASTEYRQMLVDTKMDDIVLSSAFGIHLETNWLGPSLEAEGFRLDEIRDPTTRIPSEVYATHYSKLWSAGHSAGGVHDVPPAGELIRRLVAEYENLSNSLESPGAHS
jgi:nitronate monooxygenase